jgi:hypothetical protein
LIYEAIVWFDVICRELTGAVLAVVAMVGARAAKNMGFHFLLVELLIGRAQGYAGKVADTAVIR